MPLRQNSLQNQQNDQDGLELAVKQMSEAKTDGERVTAFKSAFQILEEEHGDRAHGEYTDFE